MLFRQASPRYLVDFGQHGSLLSQPLVAPSTDSVQTDEKELANRVTVAPRDKDPASVPSETLPPPRDKESDSEKSGILTGPDRRHHIALIVLAVLLVVCAAIALPLWLVPSGTGRHFCSM